MSKCINPVRITKNLDRQKYPDGLEVPCGKCLYCRSQKKREWALRLTHELTYWQDSSFITLTYNDACLPQGKYGIPSLDKAQLQKYFKRLRKNLPPYRKIKYFACGEYGTITQRPHYHIIMLGLGLNDADKQLTIAAWPLCDWDNPAIYQGSFGLAEAKSINYVAKYINKQLSGDAAFEMYDCLGREPVFRLLSNGLGSRFADDNKTQIIQQERVTLAGISHSIPRYYINRLNIDVNSITNRAIEIERDLVNDLTGLQLTRDDLYKVSDAKTIMLVEDYIRAHNNQHDANMYAKIELTKDKL